MPDNSVLSSPPPKTAGPDLSTRAPRTPEQRERLALTTSECLAHARVAPPTEADQLRGTVVTSHLWLATSLTRRFRGRGEEEEDLLQVARCGLVEAVIRHDPSRGEYAPFAASTIVGMLKRHFRDHAWSVRPPRPTQELAAEVWKVWPDLAQSGAETPSDGALAAELGASVVDVRQARMATAGYRTSSLDSPFFEERVQGLDGWGDVDQVDSRVLLGVALARLTEDEQRLVSWRFYEQCTQSEIAERLGTHQMQVSRLLSRMLVKLRGIIGPLDEREVVPHAA